MKPLNAREGYWLTQRDCEDNERIFTKSVTGVRATYEYWRDAPNEEKEQWEQEHPAPEVDNN